MIVVVLIGVIVLCCKAKKKYCGRKKDAFSLIKNNPTDANTTDNQQTEHSSSNMEQQTNQVMNEGDRM